MFNLEEKISEWRKQMLTAGIKSPVPLEELENHLREDVEQRIRAGASVQEAFAFAVLQFGQANMLTDEFKKTGGLIAPLAAAPPQLLAYTIFAVAVTFIDHSIIYFAPGSVRAWLIPYTGWVPSVFYSFSIFFAFMLIYQHQKRNLVRLVISLQLLHAITVGIFAAFRVGSQSFGNPYLTISAWRPVWTVLIPIIWIAVLHSPRMNQFCSRKSKEQYV